MVVLGVDPHKKNHTIVAADELGRHHAQITIPATDDGHRQLLAWAKKFHERRWAVEDGRHVNARLVRALIGLGETVTLVPVKLMAQARRGGRGRGKSDPIDALAVARAALREPDLPVAHLDDTARQVRLLVDDRENLVTERTRTINRLRWRLVDLDPTLEASLGSLSALRTLQRLSETLKAHHPGPKQIIDYQIVMRLIARVHDDTATINALDKQIRELVTPLAPNLLAIVGISHLGAAKIIGEVAGIARFATPAKLANHAGTACIPVWTGNVERHRLNRGANRQLNCAIHRIAITQRAHHRGAQALLERRLAGNDTKAGAYRVLKRHLSDVIYRAMKADAQLLQNTQQPPLTHAA